MKDSIDTAFSVSVRVPLPQPQYKALNRLADQQAMTVGELVGLLVGQSLRKPLIQQMAEPPRRRPGRYDTTEIQRLHGLGLDDVQIANRVGCHERTVRNHRALLGLLSNRGIGRPSITSRAGGASL